MSKKNQARPRDRQAAAADVALSHVDVIRMIGDVLTDIDVAIGSVMPDDPNLVKLQDARRLLDARQLALSRQVFDDNTERFQAAAAKLKAVNDEIRVTLRRLDDLVALVGNINRFLNAVTSFLGTVGTIV